MNNPSKKNLLVCDCIGTQSIDAETIGNTLDVSVSKVCSTLCTSQLAIAEKAMLSGDTMIACQQERHVFEELADDMDVDRPVFVDIRDRAGWSEDKRSATGKMAALIADAEFAIPATKAIDVESTGICLIIGEADVAFAAAQHLKDALAVTVLLSPDADPGSGTERGYDVVYGKLASATGALGNFKIKIDAFQERIPGGRGVPAFTEQKDGAASNCDIVLDLSGGNPLFPAHEKREGYLRADPKSAEAKLSAILEAIQLKGTFEKPLYVRMDEPLCAHSRAQKTGCTRCLDLCPTGAISPAGEHVVVDPMVCAGCGMCSAVCPSGAISYDAPPVSVVFKRMEKLATTFRKLSKDAPRLLIHDETFGAELIRLSARYGKGLPADVIPMEVSALAAFGHAEALAALGSGFAGVCVLTSPTTEKDGLALQVEIANAISGREAISICEPSEPDALDAFLWNGIDGVGVAQPILPLGTRRQVTRLSAKALNEPDAVIGLPAGAPYGSVNLNTDACTLCLSCVSLCPSGALTENPDLPQLRFQEDACLQCGICVNICPEKAVTLEPRLNLADEALSQVVLHEEEPFACISCGALFGVRSTVMRITEQLAGKHSMFVDDNAARMIQMCDNCRVNANFHSDNNPFASGERPKVRTSADYQQSKRRDH